MGIPHLSARSAVGGPMSSYIFADPRLADAPRYAHFRDNACNPLCLPANSPARSPIPGRLFNRQHCGPPAPCGRQPRGRIFGAATNRSSSAAAGLALCPSRPRAIGTVAFDGVRHDLRAVESRLGLALSKALTPRQYAGQADVRGEGQGRGRAKSACQGAGRCPSDARWPQAMHKLRPERRGGEAWP